MKRISQGLQTAVQSRRVWGVLAASVVLAPVIAYATPVKVPNTFAPDEVISSSAMNTNFATVEAGINANDGRITALESAVSPKDCTWAVDKSTGSKTWRMASCPANKFAISGGCHSFSNDLEMSKPYNPQVEDGDPGSTAGSWYCEFDVAQTDHAAYALCCAF